MGPYTENELAARIRGREILVIDEAMLPLSRWRLIRDEPVFSGAVEDVRKGQMTAREDTEIQGHTQTQTQTQNQNQNQTQTRTLTQTPSAENAQAVRAAVELEQETTTAPNLSPLDDAPIDVRQVRDAEFVDVTQVREEPTNFRSSRDLGMRQYGAAGSSYQTGASGFNIKGVVWAVAIVVGVISIVVYFRGRAPETQSTNLPVASQDFSHLLGEAKEAWNIGDFSRSMSLLRRANIGVSRPEVVARLAPLMIQIEAQTVSAKRLLHEALGAFPANGDATVRAELELGLGLAALQSDEFNEAELHTRSALVKAPQWFPARFNYGIVAYQKRAYADATQRFSAAGDHAAALLMTVRSLIATDRFGQAASRQLATATVQTLIDQHQDFRQEGLVLGALLDLEAGNKRAAMARARAALDVDPDLTNEHWHDPFLYLEPLGWRSLVSVCRRLADELKSPVTRALLGLCLFKAGNRTEAGEIISDAVAQTTGAGTQLLQSVNAYIMTASNRLEDARAALKIATKEDPPVLATIMKARVCARGGDAVCAEQAWLDIHQSESTNLPALIGLAEFRMKKGDRLGALGLVDKARQISPNYLPALAFKGGLQK